MIYNSKKIQKQLNEYGNYILNCIKNEYGNVLNTNQLQTIDKLLVEDFIIVEEKNEEDIIFFSKQEGINDPNKYNEEFVPTAHGGVAKGDGKIHIYPYAKGFEGCKTDEDIIECCIDNIIIHEIFHYFIKPYLSLDNKTVKEEFGHFITEGLVQYYAIIFAKKT